MSEQRTVSQRRVTTIDDVQRYLDDLTTAVNNLALTEFQGTGTPEGSVTAGVGSIYRRRDGGIGSTLYVKEAGTGNTGWAAK